MEQISVQDRDDARWLVLTGEWDQTDVLHLKPEYALELYQSLKAEQK